MSPRFYDVVHADDLRKPFDSSQRCRFEVDSEFLPDGWGEWCCYRPTWDGNDYCIWHVEDTHKPPKDLHHAQEFERSWPQKFGDIDLTRRLDQINLRGFQVDDTRQDDDFQQPLSFTGCTMFSSNFYGSDMSQSWFRNVHLNRSNFEDATCRYTLFQRCDLDETIFKYANLEGARILRQQVQEANWVGVHLEDANLHDSNFTNTNLRLAKFEDTYMTQATLRDCNLEEAELENADLRNVDLQGAKLFETLIKEVRINEGTEFGELCTYESEADSIATGSGETLLIDRYNQVLKPLIRFKNRVLNRSDDSESLRKSIRVYRLYQRLLREASLPEDIRQYRVRERHSRRKHSLRKGRYLRWFKLSFDRWAMLYGESPSRVVGASLMIILGFSLLFRVVGQFQPTPDNFTDTLYFSVITFTTSGSGDFQPVTEGTRLLLSIEALSGTLLMALLVFVLGRRATW